MRTARGLWAVLLLAPLVAAQEVGGPLAPWSAGGLDIHQIHTGRGNAAYLVFPDGTSMLLDAGSVPEREGLEIGPRRPNATRTTAEWIARYILQAGPGQPAQVDYAVVTHYHDDHMAALAGVAAEIPMATLIDRGLDPPPPGYPVVRKYLEFRRSFPGKVESLRVGRAGQIGARRGGGGGSGFEVRNVAGNGVVWTGVDDQAASVFPPGWRTLPTESQPTENDFSLALLIRYGKFRYYTGGDLAGVPLDDAPAWRDLETPVARVAGPVDVAVLNHHGWLDTTNPFFLRTMNPRVVVVPAWHATHPDHGVLRRLRSPVWKPAPPDLFITTLLDAPRAVFSYLGESFRSTEGHIVVRVEPGGGSYRVIILDARSETLRVKAVHGPYSSRGR